MARHRVIPFDELGFDLHKKGIVSRSNPKYNAIRQAMWHAAAKTIGGYAAMGALCLLAYWGFHFAFALSAFFRVLGWGSLLWFAWPIALWWFSADLVARLQTVVPTNPGDERELRVRRLLDEAYEESDLKVKPPFLVISDPTPNAAATGPIHRKARVFVTSGFLDLAESMSDEEIKAVLAHELSHVRNYDVAINSLLSVLSMLFFLIVNAGLYTIFGGIALFRRLFGLFGSEGWGATIWTSTLMGLLLFPVYWITSQVTRVIQVFVVRSRESAADATAAYFTGDPCALASALHKLVEYANNHRPPPGTHQFALYQVLRPMMLIDPLFDSNTPEFQSTNAWQRVKSIWRYLQLTHPPVPERVYQLERMNGGSCLIG